MIRVFGFSLLMLFAVAVTLPVIESQAGYGKQVSASWRKRNKRMTRRQYRAYLRRRRAVRARQRMLARLRAQQRAVAASGVTPQVIAANAVAASTAGTPHVVSPAGWSGGRATGGETRWQIPVAGRSDAAIVTFAPLGFAASDDANTNPRAKTFAGHSHADLRRQVIDRMIAEGGWVTNDLVRVIGGRRTFVVSAASGRAEAPNRWTYYFTVVDDRLYRFVAFAPEDQADKVAGEVEAMVAALRSSASAPLTARGSE